MNIYLTIIGVATILTGIFFLMVGGTDFHYGIGLILLFMGLNNIPKALEKKPIA